jgi:hypothetical protein
MMCGSFHLLSPPVLWKSTRCLLHCYFCCWARLAQLVSALGQRSKGSWFETQCLDSDHILSPITNNWFAGVSIVWLAAPTMHRGVWALSNFFPFTFLPLFCVRVSAVYYTASSAVSGICKGSNSWWLVAVVPYKTDNTHLRHTSQCLGTPINHCDAVGTSTCMQKVASSSHST